MGLFETKKQRDARYASQLRKAYNVKDTKKEAPKKQSIYSRVKNIRAKRMDKSLPTKGTGGRGIGGKARRKLRLYL